MLIQIWPRRHHAWPLLLFTLPLYSVLAWFVGLARASPGRLAGNWPVHTFCEFVGQPPTAWTLGVIWFLMDGFLIVWIDRALNRPTEPFRPAKLFFLWQGVKLAFIFLYFAVLTAHSSLNPEFGLRTYG
jgi:hypothetical protein